MFIVNHKPSPRATGTGLENPRELNTPKLSINIYIHIQDEQQMRVKLGRSKIGRKLLINGQPSPS
jgi:hypothetical protein